MALVQALRAEALKSRRTLALWMALLAPLLIEVLDFILYFQRGYIRHDVENPWLWLGQQTLVYWSLLMLPLIITLQTALLANVEHSNQQWKHLFVLPTPRGAIYAAKQIAAMVLVGFSTLSLLALTVLNGLLLRTARPGIGLDAPIPWRQLLTSAGFIFLGSWLLISLHTWVGARWKSFVVAMGFGIAMTVAGMVVINWEWGRFYPWALPGLVANSFMEGTMPIAEILVGSVGGLVVAIAGGWEFTRRDVL
jgi:hypothetical protein